MLSRQILKSRSLSALRIMAVHTSKRYASQSYPDSIIEKLVKKNAPKVPLELLSIIKEPSTTPLESLQPQIIPSNLASKSEKNPGILAKSDEDNDNDNKNDNVTNEGNKKTNNNDSSNGSGNGKGEDGETAPPKPKRKKKEQQPKESESTESAASPPLPPRIKTPNSQRGSPTEKMYQSASTNDKEQVLVLPISSRPLIPGFHKAVSVRNRNVINALQKIHNYDIESRCIGVFMLKDSKKDTEIITSSDEVYDVGVYARIGGIINNDNGSVTVVLYPLHRIKMGDIIPPLPSGSEEQSASPELSPEELLMSNESSSHAREIARKSLFRLPVSWSSGVEDLNDLPYDPNSAMISALAAEILRVLKSLSEVNSSLKEQVMNIVLTGNKYSTSNVYEEPHILADFAASISAGRSDEIQGVVSSLNIEDRLQKSLSLIKREYENLKLQKKVSKDVDEKIQKKQKEYYLMEQMKGIKKELGMEDGRDKLIDTFRQRVAGLTLPENVEKVFEDEIQKLNTLEPNAAEFNVTRQYLDWISQLPWGKLTKDSYNLARAMRILNEDHHGLKDVKDRILEFIAVGKLVGAVDGKIILFVGPPGVGKTSVAKSIAKSLNREYYRFSIGGVSDVSELKGHRRTYVGALPGRVIQALKKTQTQNPLILIDEIDKIGRGSYNGDPSAALLELLDPEQNNSFLDHYLDIPVDMSKTLFVCTANTLDTIPGPLLDRMEIIEISGYVTEEKIAIAEEYLAPNAKKLAGLEDVDVKLTREAVEGLINKYCRESGVRNLKKHIEKIFRKAALNIIRKVGDEDAEEKKVEADASKTEEEKAVDESIPGSSEPVENAKVQSQAPVYVPMKVPKDISIEINASDLKDYVGPPVFNTDRMYEENPIGVVMGLGVTGLGGTSLYVESVLEQPISAHSSASFSRTGQLGDTMKESSAIAYSFSRMYLMAKYPRNRFFERAKIHLHCPEGAIPKDGPSAGVTMATSLLSLALDYAVDPIFAMTGELTLTGKVLRIGGLREKAVAAKRAGAKTVFFPKDNLADWEAMPENVKKDLEGVPVGWYSEIYDRVFKDVGKVEGLDQLWQEQYRKVDEAGEKHATLPNA